MSRVHSQDGGVLDNKTSANMLTFDNAYTNANTNTVSQNNFQSNQQLIPNIKGQPRTISKYDKHQSNDTLIGMSGDQQFNHADSIYGAGKNAAKSQYGQKVIKNSQSG